jgi:hypothetical protein
MSQVPLSIGFRRALTDNKRERWIHLRIRLMNAQLSSQEDVFVWKL